MSVKYKLDFKFILNRNINLNSTTFIKSKLKSITNKYNLNFIHNINYTDTRFSALSI